MTDVRLRRRRRAPWVIAAGAAVLIGVLVGVLVTHRSSGSSASGDRALQQLLGDPMAERDRPGARLTVADETASEGKSVINPKGSHTTVTRAFTPTSGTLPELYQQLRRAAEAAGWELRPDAGGAGTQGEKQFQFGRAKLSITPNEYLSPPAVAIVMTPDSP